MSENHVLENMNKNETYSNKIFRDDENEQTVYLYLLKYKKEQGKKFVFYKNMII